MNKLNKFVPALLVAGVLALIPLTKQAKADPQRPRAAAVFYIISDPATGKFYVLNISMSGTGLPQIKEGDDAADAIRSLLEAGMTMADQSHPLSYTFLR